MNATEAGPQRATWFALQSAELAAKLDGEGDAGEHPMSRAGKGEESRGK